MNQNTITRNTTYYTIAQIIQKLLAFLYFTFIARTLGPENTGKYAFALAFTTMFVVVVDIGLSQVLIREIARAKEKVSEFLGNILSFKIPLSIFTYGLVILTINLLGYPSLTKNLVYLAGFIMILDSFSMTFWAVFRGFQNLKFESFGIVYLEIIIVTLGSLTLIFHLGLIALILALLSGSFFQFIYSLYLVRYRAGLSISFHYRPETIKFLLKIAIPFALAGVFNRFYTSIDTVLLSKLGGDEYVGWYSIGTKITLALQFIPMAFIAALFPAMSRFFVSDKEKLSRVFEKAFKYLMIIGLPIAFGIVFLAREIVVTVFKLEFIEAVSSLQILMASLIFLFLNFPVGYLLNACNRQVRNTVNMGIALFFNILLNAILIPRFFHKGAALASLIGTVILFSLGMYLVPKIISYNRKFILINFLKIIFSVGVMVLVIWYFKSMIHLVALIPLAAAIYFIVLYLVRGFREEDLLIIYRSIKSRG